MTSKRVSAPFDLMNEFESDDDEPKKQTTLTTQQTVVGTQAPPKPAISKQTNQTNDKRIEQANVEHADPKMKEGDKVRLKVMKGAIDSSTLKPNWSRGIYAISRAKPAQSSKAPGR